jgi:hypothetical protein
MIERSYSWDSCFLQKLNNIFPALDRHLALPAHISPNNGLVDLLLGLKK